MILSYVIWFILFGWWAATRFWSVRNALQTGSIKTGLKIGRTVYRSADRREFDRVMCWRIFGGALWTGMALIPVLAIMLTE